MARRHASPPPQSSPLHGLVVVDRPSARPVDDTFLQDGTNRRTDDYGGGVSGRARFPLQLAAAFVDVFGADRVGVRVSPSGTWGSISDSDPETTFGYFAERLSDLKIAYLHVIEPRVSGTETVAEGQAPVAAAFLRQHFTGSIIAAGGFDGVGAGDIVRRGDADLVAFDDCSPPTQTCLPGFVTGGR